MTELNYAKNKKRKKKKSRKNKTALGALLSFFLITYLMASGFMLTRKVPLSIEVVQMGTINNNIHSKGVIIRDEILVKSPREGSIQYLMYEGEKIKQHTPICIVGDNPALNNLQKDIDKVNDDIVKLQNQRKDFSTIQKEVQEINYQISDLVKKSRDAYSNKNYVHLYSLKSAIKLEIEKKQTLLSKENTSSLQGLILQKKEYENQISQNSNVVKAPKGGIISYYTDGLEEKFTIDNLDKITEKDIEKTIEIKDISQNQTANKNSALFKIVDNYAWYIASSISKESAEGWEEGDFFWLKFNGEPLEIKVNIHRIQPLDKDFMIIFKSTENMLPLISKRNVEFEILKDNIKGIKIPINSIVKKIFIKIPKIYLQQSGKQLVVIKKGSENDVLIPIEVAYEDEENIYVLQDFSTLKLYESLILPQDASKELILKENEEKVGVFVVNGGIIRFKPIKVLVQNKEYAVVEQDTPSGIRLYDQVVSNAKNVRENQLINQFNVIDNK